MSKTNLIIAGTIIAVVLIGGVTAYVKANGTDDNFNGPKIVEKAIEDGIISEEKANKLQDYIKEQRHGKKQEMMEKRIEKAVENGKISQQEAQEIKDWFNNQPGAMEKLKPMMGQKMRRGMRAKHARQCTKIKNDL